MSALQNCDSWFNCDASKNYSLEEVIRLMIVADENGCPVWRGTSSSTPEGTVETPSASTVTAPASGSVASGAKSITFTTSSGFAGTILGEARQASTTYRLTVSNPYSTLAAVAYNVTSGSMIIDKTV